MYGKIFEQIFDSSIADDYHLRHFFMDLIVLADSDGVVNKTPTAIAARIRMPLDDVLSLLSRLSAPDPESQTPDADGRRIELIDEHRTWGWHIINYRKYREIATEEQRKLKTRQRVARFTLKRKELQKTNASLTPANDPLTPPYAYPYASSSEERGSVEGENHTLKLKELIGKMMNRTNGDAWTYAEQQNLCEIARRPKCLSEFMEILKFKGRAEAKYFPHSVSTLIEKWTATLDRARRKSDNHEYDQKMIDKAIPGVPEYLKHDNDD